MGEHRAERIMIEEREKREGETKGKRREEETATRVTKIERQTG